MSERKFAFKAADLEGLETLETMFDAHRFNHWMYDTISQYLRPGKTLEIGSGIGNISQHFLNDERPIVLSDIRDQYLNFLRKHLSDQHSLEGIRHLDLVHPQFANEYADLLNQFDNVFALNVVEHIKDDALAIKNATQLLKPGGHLVILVPAYPALYNRLDKSLYHFRRYRKREMISLMEGQQLRIKRAFSFNMMGILGWFISGKIQGNELIPRGQIKLYDMLVPVFKIIDRLSFRKIGLSVIVSGEK